jgi:hypothetical protein
MNTQRNFRLSSAVAIGMVGTLRSVTTDLPTVPFPRRPLDPGDEIRRWYENELGWPTVPGSTARPGGQSARRSPGGPGIPVLLRVGVRFDVLDVPAEAGRAALRHLVAGSPVALQGGRMRLLVAAGSAEELPGVLDWLEWGTLPLDLTMIGEGGAMDAPPPPGSGPGMTTRPLRAPGPAAAVPGGHGPERSAAAPGGDRRSAAGQGAASPGVAAQGVAQGAASQEAGVLGASVLGAAPGSPVARGAASQEAAAHGAAAHWAATRGAALWETGMQETAARGPGTLGAAVQGPAGREVASQWPAAQELLTAQEPATLGAAVWLRPPEPGCEVEASLPTMSAMGGGGGAPDLVRVLNTVATHCHRLRLRRAGARPSVVPRARR